MLSEYSLAHNQRTIRHCRVLDSVALSGRALFLLLPRAKALGYSVWPFHGRLHADVSIYAIAFL
jgi:hypothetical protein